MDSEDEMNVYNLLQGSIDNISRYTQRIVSENQNTEEFIENIAPMLQSYLNISTEFNVLETLLYETLANTVTVSDEVSAPLLTVKDLYASSCISLYLYSDNNKFNDTECSICTEKYIPNQSIVRILKCEHMFCVDCIDKWLSANNKCPMCKFNLEKGIP